VESLTQQTESNNIMSKQWRLRPEYADIRLQAKDVAALFVSVTSAWYEEPLNALYRKKEFVYHMIVRFLETGSEPESISHEMIYVLNKFQTEWYEPGNMAGMFEEAE